MKTFFNGAGIFQEVPKYRGKITGIKDDIAYEMWCAGWSVVAIAEILGVDGLTVTKWRDFWIERGRITQHRTIDTRNRALPEQKKLFEALKKEYKSYE